jgi:RpiR family carbohydrate utilization transcriptional regulator
VRERIAEVLDRLTPAERRVAEFVAADLGAVPEATVASVARAAGVSEPTVIRFCRALGLDGFSGLRLAVVRDQAAGPAPAPRRIEPGMPAGEAGIAALESGLATLSAARQALDRDLLARAALALLLATRVEIWGSGAAFAPACHLEAALAGLCRGVVARSDAARQREAAIGLEAEGVAVCFSPMGTERDLLVAARLAAAGGASVIAITRPASPMAMAASLILPCVLHSEAGPGDPAALLPFALAEAMAAAAAALAPPAAAARLRRIAEARTEG